MKVKGETKKDSDELEEDDGAQIDSEIENLREEADVIWEECKEHTESSNHGHYLQLQIGNMMFYTALLKFLSTSLERPPRWLDFSFNNAIEQLAGDEFMAEHRGFEQTNVRALNSFGKFGLIAKVCAAAYPTSDPKHKKIREDFALYEDLARKLHALALLMKSQKRIDSNNFDNKLLDFILAWNKAIPGKTYSNKLYSVMMHLPDFVEEYGICGRVFEESHESVHARILEKGKRSIG